MRARGPYFGLEIRKAFPEECGLSGMVRSEQEVARQREKTACSKLVQDPDVEDGKE